MFYIGHFRGYQHACSLFHPLKPFQTHRAHSLKGIGPGPGFPDPCTKDFNAHVRQGFSGVHYLLFGLCTAGPCHKYGLGKNIAIKRQGF